MANEPQKLISRRHRIVGPAALTQKILVGLLAFDRKKADVLSTFPAEDFVCVGSLLSNRLVFLRSLTPDDTGRMRSVRRRVLIRSRAGSRKHIVRARPSSAYDSVRSLVDGSKRLVEGMIRLLAFETKALVGPLAL